MATLNKPIEGYLDTKGFVVNVDMVMRVIDDGKSKSLSLSTFAGLTLTAPLDKQNKAELIKALGE